MEKKRRKIGRPKSEGITKEKTIAFRVEAEVHEVFMKKLLDISSRKGERISAAHILTPAVMEFLRQTP